MGPLSIYLDTNLIVPSFVKDSFVERARNFFATGPEDLIISDFASAEFSAVIGVRVRTGDLSPAEAAQIFANFDTWTSQAAINVKIDPRDLDRATALARHLELALRAPDAIHLAIAQRAGADLATFDARMAASARKLGITVLDV